MMVGEMDADRSNHPTADTSRKRRPHTKSRAGCGNCKRRRIKAGNVITNFAMAFSSAVFANLLHAWACSAMRCVLFATTASSSRSLATSARTYQVLLHVRRRRQCLTRHWQQEQVQLNAAGVVRGRTGPISSPAIRCPTLSSHRECRPMCRLLHHLSCSAPKTWSCSIIT